MSFRLPALQIFTKNCDHSFAHNAEEIGVWELQDKDVVVGDYRITGVYNTSEQLNNQKLVYLLRFCQDPINGYYDYVKHLFGPNENRHHVLVQTDQGNAMLTFHTYLGGKPEIRLLTQQEIICSSLRLTTFVRRLLNGQIGGKPMSAEQVMVLMELFTNQVNWDRTAITHAHDDSNAGNNSHALLHDAFGSMAAEEIVLIIEGLWQRVIKESQLQP